MLEAIKSLKDPTAAFKESEYPSIPEGLRSVSIKELILLKEIKEYMRRERLVKVTVHKVFGLVWGQCSEGLQSSVQLNSEYKKKTTAYDGVWLLKEV